MFHSRLCGGLGGLVPSGLGIRASSNGPVLCGSADRVLLPDLLVLCVLQLAALGPTTQFFYLNRIPFPKDLKNLLNIHKKSCQSPPFLVL